VWKNQILFDSRSFFDVVIYGDASTSSKKKQKNVKIEYDDNEVKESKEVSQMVDNLRAEVKDEDVLLLLRLLLNDTNAQPKSITILKGKLSNTRKSNTLWKNFEFDFNNSSLLQHLWLKLLS
jgi:hypothetical protein